MGTEDKKEGIFRGIQGRPEGSGTLVRTQNLEPVKGAKTQTPAVAPNLPMVSVMKRIVKVGVNTLTRENFRLRVLIVGPTGSGKSTLLTTIPGKKLFIDWDGRKESIEGLPEMAGSDIVQLPEPDPRSPKAWDDGEKLRKELWSLVRQGKFDYDAVIEDGLSFMDAACMRWSLLLDPKHGLGGAPAQQHYSPVIKNLGDHIDSMRSLPCHYALTAHAMLATDQEEQNSLTMTLKVNSKVLKASIPPMFNEIWMMRSIPKEKEQQYWLYTAPTGKYDFLKSGLNQIGKFWSSPIRINWDDEPKGVEELLDVRFGRVAVKPL